MLFRGRVRTLPWLVVAAIVSLLPGCGDGSDDGLVVFAASSLTDVLPAIVADFEDASGQRVEVSYAASSTLREQLLDGAPADVFLSANVALVAELTQVGLVSGTVVPVAVNSLVLAVPQGNPAGVTGIDDVGSRGLVVGVCAPEVPCGVLATAALEAAGIESSIDTYEPNARALLTKLELGEIDVALVYRSDVLGTDQLETVPSSEVEAQRTTYVAAILTGAPDAASALVDQLRSAEGQARLLDAGFELP